MQVYVYVYHSALLTYTYETKALCIKLSTRDTNKN